VGNVRVVSSAMLTEFAAKSSDSRLASVLFSCLTLERKVSLPGEISLQGGF
jgi:hypothetical protein